MKTTPYTITQQSLNLIRQTLNSVGWSKTIADIYTAGKLLADEGGLPALDSIEWIKTKEQLAALTPEEMTEYLKIDSAWGNKPVTFSLTEKQTDVIGRSFAFYIDAIGKEGKLGHSIYYMEVIETFGLKPSESEA